MLATKERITANRSFSSERYIRSTHPVLYVPLYKKDGPQFTSSDAYGHLCTVTGALWGIQGRTFDALDDSVNCGSNAALNILTDITVEFWVKFDTVTGDRVCVEMPGKLAIFGNTAKVAFLSRGNGKYSISSAGSLAIDTWYHIVGAYSTSWTAMKLFINGNEVSYGTQDAMLGASLGALSAAVTLGMADANPTLDGILGEVRIYNRALTALEVQRNYLATKWRYS